MTINGIKIHKKLQILEIMRREVYVPDDRILCPFCESDIWGDFNTYELHVVESWLEHRLQNSLCIQEEEGKYTVVCPSFRTRCREMLQVCPL